MRTKLNVGIIGLGVGEKHIDAYESHPDCEIISLCDFDEAKLSKAKEKYPGMKLTRDTDEILNNPDIDVVSIASFDNYHYEQLVQAITNGKHIFVEKPLCLYPHEAIEIRRLLKDNPEIRLSSNLNLRTCPRFIRLKDAITSGEMGRVFHIEGDYLWGRINKLTNGWRKEMEFYSIIYGAAVHMIDLLMWMTEMKPVGVQGYGNGIATADCDFRYNDFASILLKFENGMTSKVNASGGCVHPHFHRVAVYGTRKTFIHDILGAKWIETSDPKSEQCDVVEAYPSGDKKGEVISSFIDSILYSNSKPIVSTDAVFDTMSVCFAAEKAIHEETPTIIEYI